jgi:hypothetical protein
MRAKREKTGRIRTESSDADRMRQAIYSLQQILLNSKVFVAFRVKGALFQLADSFSIEAARLEAVSYDWNELPPTRYRREAVPNSPYPTILFMGSIMTCVGKLRLE